MTRITIDFDCSDRIGAWERTAGYEMVDDIIAECIENTLREHFNRNLSVRAEAEYIEDDASGEYQRIYGYVTIYEGDKVAYTGVFCVKAYDVEENENLLRLGQGWTEIQEASEEQ